MQPAKNFKNLRILYWDMYKHTKGKGGHEGDWLEYVQTNRRRIRVVSLKDESLWHQAHQIVLFSSSLKKILQNIYLVKKEKQHLLFLS